MSQHLRANLWLLAMTVILCSVLYPLALLGIGQVVFPERAGGSLVLDDAGKAIGSRLIAQPFTSDEYFQPRPSATSYNAAASGASNWGANNYLLRERVARQLGPIVKYRSGAMAGQPIGPDIERWFQLDRASGKPGIVAQWAALHGSVAQNWVKADPLNTAYVAEWQKSHSEEVAQWKTDNPDAGEPKPEDMAVPFFTSFSQAHPGTFPAVTEHKSNDGKTSKRIEPTREGTDIQGIFFDMWLQDHRKADLEPVPADMVMTSGSGLDPDITLQNALYQLDRVAGKLAEKTKGNSKIIRDDIERLLRDNAKAPLQGVAGEPLVNVLEINLALGARYAP